MLDGERSWPFLTNTTGLIYRLIESRHISHMILGSDRGESFEPSDYNMSDAIVRLNIRQITHRHLVVIYLSLFVHVTHRHHHHLVVPRLHIYIVVDGSTYMILVFGYVQR